MHINIRCQFNRRITRQLLGNTCINARASKADAAGMEIGREMQDMNCCDMLFYSLYSALSSSSVVQFAKNIFMVYLLYILYKYAIFLRTFWPSYFCYNISMPILKISVTPIFSLFFFYVLNEFFVFIFSEVYRIPLVIVTIPTVFCC